MFTRKQGEEPLSRPKVLQFVTIRSSPLCARTNARNRNPLYGLLTILWIPRGVGGISLAVVPTSLLPYFFSVDSYLTQTSPAAHALSGPTSAGIGTTPPAERRPASASAWRSHEESCAALPQLPPAVAPGTNGPW